MLSYLDTMALGEHQRKVQNALELERNEIVGRVWHNHHQQEETGHYRNGYSKPRCLTCDCFRSYIYTGETQGIYCNGGPVDETLAL